MADRYNPRNRLTAASMYDQGEFGDPTTFNEMHEFPRFNMLLNGIGSGLMGGTAIGSAALGGPPGAAASVPAALLSYAMGSTAKENYDQIQGRHPQQLRNEDWLQKILEAYGQHK